MQYLVFIKTANSSAKNFIRHIISEMILLRIFETATFKAATFKTANFKTAKFKTANYSLPNKQFYYPIYTAF